MPFTQKDHDKARKARTQARLHRIRRAHILHKEGLTRLEIANLLGVKKRRVSDYLKEPVPLESEVY